LKTPFALKAGCQGSIDGWEPGIRKGYHYISMHQIKVDRALWGRPYISVSQTRVDYSLAPDETKQAADASGRFVAGDLASL
jgi:hypothetical protein